MNSFPQRSFDDSDDDFDENLLQLRFEGETELKTDDQSLSDKDPSDSDDNVELIHSEEEGSESNYSVHEIQINNVSKAYKKDKQSILSFFRRGISYMQAVDNLSVNIPSGQLVCLLGHNGAGKTTLTNLLIGWKKPTNGTIRLQSEGITLSPQGANPNQLLRLKEIVGYCPQDDLLW
eukprot:CAMPEP_0117422754 /NCGR_PEP_ID=MMETSP0758-20121206/3539_1 /TAXON_ID=63605 /ORGANISM="Percolomonas cosmopolitus, Strain AE-1 (ATCC 50343)" /LENGTH=176 /DNA_ID=CAMNT_0005205581 /DNA_START=983 /DNA_END=1510 /DNA_ORIENTATION=-